MPQGVFPGSPIVLGKDAKMRIGVGATALGIRSGTITTRAADHEVGDTEDAVIGGLSSGTGVGPMVPAQGTIVGFEAHQGGRQVAEVTVTWFSNFALVPTTALLNIAQGTILASLAIFPKGTPATAAGSWAFPFFQILENVPFRHDIDRPQEGSFTGKSIGPFSSPTV